MRLRSFIPFLALAYMAVAHATVNTQNLSVSFVCSGTTGPFPFTFPISDPTALTVTQNGTALGPTAYTITPVNNNYNNGGSVTLNTSCSAGQTLVLQRITLILQKSVFTDNMPIPMKTFENGLDKNTEIEQELGNTLENAECPVNYVLQGVIGPVCVPNAGGPGGGVGAGVATQVASYPVPGNNVIGTSNVSLNVNSQINVMAYPYLAKGDCSTDDHNAIMAASNAAYSAIPPKQVFFPQPSGGCYLTSTLTWLGVSLAGVPSGQGSAIGNMISQIRSKPGQDLFNVPDVNDVAIQNPHNTFSVTDLDLVVDDSVDVSSSHPYRLTGRTFTDAGMTSGSPILTSASGNAEFAGGDVGNAITVAGAGPSGATLTTTIVSVQSASQATLAVNASTNVTNAISYISVNGLSATQSVGNCVLAWDQRDGQQSNWKTPGSGTAGMNYAVWRDVNVRSLSGHNLNHSCGFFLQGAGGAYGTLWDNVNIQRLGFGYTSALQVLNTAVVGAGTGDDFNVWKHGKWDSTYPFIYYDGGANRIEDIQIGNTNGAQIIDAWTPVEYEAGEWFITIPEVENATGVAFRLGGVGHTLSNTQLTDAGGTGYWDASNSRCINCIALGTLQLNGYLNDILLQDAIDQVTIQNNGIGNSISGKRMYGPFGGIEPSRETAMLNQRPWPVATKTADFLTHGLGATPYSSDLDTWYWAEDMLVIGTGSGALTPDPTAQSGKNVAFANSGNLNAIVAFNGLRSSGLFWNIGSLIPVVKTNITIRLKCDTPQNISIAFNVTNPTTHAGIPLASISSYACTTSYQTAVLPADLTPYNTYQPSISMNIATGLIRVDWVAFQPWNGSTGSTGTTEVGTSQVDVAANVANVTSSGNINIVPVSNPALNILAPALTGGTIPDASSYHYAVTAINACGETLYTEGATTTGSGGNLNSINVGWLPTFGATGYKLYRTAAGGGLGTELFLASITVSATATQYFYVDTGAITPSGALPGSNTTQCHFEMNGTPIASGTTTTICSGAIIINPGTSISANTTFATPSTATCTGLLTTDTITLTINGDPTSLTGYDASGNDVTLIPYPTANTINVKVQNRTANPITPASITVNFRVVR